MAASRCLTIGFLIFASFIGTIVPKAEAQVVLTLGSPLTSTFPIIDIGVSVTQNGLPASLISGTDFNVSEDGIPGKVLGLHGCGGTSSAAVAVVVDTSSSMSQSIGTGPNGSRSYAKFDNAVSQFIASIPGPSLLALVPFADSAIYWYPGKTINFYNSTSKGDTASFMARLDAFSYSGGTNVDAGIDLAASVLAKSTLPRRVIVLVTDDFATETDSLQLYLQSLGINLYVMDVSRDSASVDYADLDLAENTGGAYLKAYDTTLYSQILFNISQLIFAEHCILEYQSEIPCPAWANHNVKITLNYQSTQEDAYTSYYYERTTHDSFPPRFKLTDTSGGWSLPVSGGSIHAYDPFPCESGLYSLVDSASANFSLVRFAFTSDSATDSLVILDTLYPAVAYFVATDSAGNVSRYHVHYEPQPDTHPPQFGIPIRTGGSYTDDIEEMLPWDRGIDTVYLLPGAINLSLDSVVYASKQLAHAYLKIIKAKDSASGCLIGIDSVGNRDSVCIEWDGEYADTLPPVFTQDPLADPFLSMSGVVTEERLHDRGIRKVIVTPLTNTANPSVIYDSIEEARVGVSLTDSLYPALAMVEAYDSADNYMRDTMIYNPMPDINPPILTYTKAGKSTFIFLATDTQAWDRGVAFLLQLGQSVNCTASQTVFPDGHHGALTVTVTDRTLNATILVQATDSAGHQTEVTVNFIGIPLVPLGDSVIDFGTQIAPVSITRSVLMTNQNDLPVVLNIQTPQGDNSDFTLLTQSPVLFPAFGSQSIAFAFHPSLIGDYNASSAIQYHISVGNVTLTGRAIGSIQLALDTVHLFSGESGTLHLSIDVTPKPSNLDSIAFSLTYDPNMLTLGDIQTCPSGSPDTGVCLYNASWAGGSEGNRQALLIRNSTSQVSTLSFGSTVLDIPFQTYVSAHDTTAVHITPIDTYSGKVSIAHDGLVLAGDSCGQPLLREVITGGTLIATIVSVMPNPAQTSVTLNLQSAAEADCEIKIISIDGVVEQSLPVHLQKGEQKVVLGNLPAASGAYEIVLSSNGFEADRARIEIVR